MFPVKYTAAVNVMAPTILYIDFFGPNIAMLSTIKNMFPINMNTFGLIGVISPKIIDKPVTPPVT